MLTYKDAGVDIEKGDEFVNRIKSFAKQTFNNKVATHIGGFCALYDNGDHYLAASTDGVGTKIKLAIELGEHHTIGQDLVAMCVNDLICVGAKPLFFLDYLATSKLDLTTHKNVVKGISEACASNGIALIGGETAEMPDMYQYDDYDLAGFSVGTVKKSDVIDGQNVKEKDIIIGLHSSGPHSNGYSLIRKVIPKNERALLRECLTPTHIYVQEILDFMKNHPGVIKGMANITGGGLENISRINKNRKFIVQTPPPLTPLFSELKKRTGLNDKELYRTFNMGIGFTIICRPEDSRVLLDYFGEKAFKLGIVE